MRDAYKCGERQSRLLPPSPAPLGYYPSVRTAEPIQGSIRARPDRYPARLAIYWQPAVCSTTSYAGRLH